MLLSLTAFNSLVLSSTKCIIGDLTELESNIRNTLHFGNINTISSSSLPDIMKSRFSFFFFFSLLNHKSVGSSVYTKFKIDINAP